MRLGPVDLDWERRLGRLAGVAALAAVALVFGALIAAASAAPADVAGPLGQPEPARSNLAEQLQDFHDARGLQALALTLKVLAFALVVPLGLFLYAATRRRRPELSDRLALLAVAGPSLVAVSAVAGFFAFSDVVSEFTGGGPPTSARAEELVDGSGLLRASALFEILGRLVLGAWIAWASYSAMQVGLISRFLGLLGIGGAVAGVILLPAGEALFFGWLAGVGLIALDRWPGGRPAAWEAGRALPPG